MAKTEVERFLIAGGEDKVFRTKYNQIESMDDFVAAAAVDGYDFTDEELIVVLKEAGDSFDSSGNPRSRTIWWS
ncbi:Nif11-like leader peptide family natural product precursor [Propionicimonas sp.]|uniref:Nif11-like leader peptide family natural product precursor n=1 Tax=Propionicimonas sp. TaxID=1955623 RepID=UPI00183E96AC|nr:Nif11-like leader peptide family natural product precursor [Propionicimonas sp.]MBU3976741.1 Nif11-like leader peptide family natural product precursor [Actinomycetota bacterium]MBA3019806.1 Nif11 family protein [Propionicimonas sp.]MBU3986836.1 Nif11-like leader peptide family natural product precursor [Actinomycetota bacterium]MBU4006748.1 Nif11-like leader peptide family natural product precursor [Actinomycetota bacterium]MBU4065448.1 Nif11-like leader peptide family natural product prec